MSCSFQPPACLFPPLCDAIWCYDLMLFVFLSREPDSLLSKPGKPVNFKVCMRGFEKICIECLLVDFHSITLQYISWNFYLDPPLCICVFLSFYQKNFNLSLANHQATTDFFLCDFRKVSFCQFYVCAIGNQNVIIYFLFKSIWLSAVMVEQMFKGYKRANGRPLTLLLICPFSIFTPTSAWNLE